MESLREAVDRDERTIARGRDRDLFLCHAWADRNHAARELGDALSGLGVDVWSSGDGVVLDTDLPSVLDQGLRSSRLVVVLITPALLTTLHAGSHDDQEMVALLGTGRLVPVLHQVSHEELRAESAPLTEQVGLSTADATFTGIAAAIAGAVLPGSPTSSG